MGADYETPHEFKSGDTISADMMNELFDYIKQKSKVLTSNDFVGNWYCMALMQGNQNTLTGISVNEESSSY